MRLRSGVGIALAGMQGNDCMDLGGRATGEAEAEGKDKGSKIQFAIQFGDGFRLAEFERPLTRLKGPCKALRRAAELLDDYKHNPVRLGHARQVHIDYRQLLGAAGAVFQDRDSTHSRYYERERD